MPISLPVFSPPRTIAPASAVAEPVAAVSAQPKLTTGYVTSTDHWGTKLFFRKNIVPNAKGAVVIVHGAAEHSGRYDCLVKRLNDAGYSTYRFDHRGHGALRLAMPLPENSKNSPRMSAAPGVAFFPA